MVTGRIRVATLAAAFIFGVSVSAPVVAQVTAFKQAVAESVAGNPEIAAFYRARNFEPIWTDAAGKPRLKAFLAMAARAGDHGLPSERYDLAELRDLLAGVDTFRDRGLAEVELTRVFLRLAKDLNTGVLNPRDVAAGLERKVPVRDGTEVLTEFVAAEPAAYLRSLAPSHPEYTRLLKERRRIDAAIAAGGWGPKVRAKKLEPGDTGPAVIALRDRLMAMGYLDRSASASFDSSLAKAVEAFQLSHGLVTDGVAGEATIREINVEPQRRMEQLLVALERRRWLNHPMGPRHILVNLADFRAYVMDDDKVTFETRVVVGKNTSDRRTPEFSDTMTHMIINPTWHVPRSIATKEYLPAFKKNAGAHGYLRLYDARGRQVSRENVDFSAYSAKDFPFDIKQPPSGRNALGLVKFMFPNKYNIYLHDTPAKPLFERNRRDYSHGCVRVHKPFDLAYTLLTPQEADPKGTFHRILDTGRETQVDLDQPIPVHIVYRTAFAPAKGPVQYRRDVYDRDSQILSALLRAGVAPEA